MDTSEPYHFAFTFSPMGLTPDHLSRRPSGQFSQVNPIGPTVGISLNTTAAISLLIALIEYLLVVLPPLMFMGPVWCLPPLEQSSFLRKKAVNIDGSPNRANGLQNLRAVLRDRYSEVHSK